MFKQTNRREVRKDINTDFELPVNANSTSMQVVLNTDANQGTVEIWVETRDSITPEAAVRSDETTPVVVDFSTGERTVIFEPEISIQKIIGIVSGMNGTYLEAIANSSEVNC